MAHPDRFLLAGVMGWPVMHSRSPMLHNYWFKKHGLAGTYVPLAIRPEHLAAALRGLHPLGFAGVNVTIPHKQDAMKIVNEADALARSIGAISCVIVKPTTCGMVGQPALDIKLDKLPQGALAADIIYIPLETPFLAAARKRGNRTINGLGMLLNQGRPAWKAWFGIEPEVTAELRAMVEKTI